MRISERALRKQIRSIIKENYQGDNLVNLLQQKLTVSEEDIFSDRVDHDLHSIANNLRNDPSLKVNVDNVMNAAHGHSMNSLSELENLLVQYVGIGGGGPMRSGSDSAEYLVDDASEIIDSIWERHTGLKILSQEKMRNIQINSQILIELIGQMDLYKLDANLANNIKSAAVPMSSYGRQDYSGLDRFDDRL